MAGFFDLIKHLFFPALIALSLYALLAYLVIPLYRSQRDRYGHYLPLERLSTRTTSLRERISDFLLRGRTAFSRRLVIDGPFLPTRRGSLLSVDNESYFGDEEGESMVGFDMGRRERVRETQRTVSAESVGRLSQELEEGFMDDSDSEDDQRGDERRR